MYLIFDTETTGLPRDWNAPITDSDNWPRAIQIAWQLHDDMGNCVDHQDYLIQPQGFDIPFDAERIHGISTELAQRDGLPLADVLVKFKNALDSAKFIVGQNVGFDVNIMGAEFHRLDISNQMAEMPVLDTCTETTAQLCQIPGGRGGKFKLPTLTELHEYLFNQPFAEAHNATADVEATTRCFFELIRRRIFTIEELDVPANYFEEFSRENPQPIEFIGLKHINLKAASDEIRKELQKAEGGEISHEEIKENKEQMKEVDFAHLHNHSQFSILQSTASVQDIVNAAIAKKMPAVGLTDMGNMMGAFHFVKAIMGHNASAKKKNEELKAQSEAPTETIVKPVVGIELNVCQDRTNKSQKDNGFQIVFLAKNKKGYHNLAKMASIAYTEGFYYVPRIDREVVERYKEDIIVLTGNLYGEVPSKVLNVGEKQAEEALLWWKETFGKDLYIEIMRHGQEDEDRVNQT